MLGALLGLGAFGAGLNLVSQGWSQGFSSSQNELNRDFNRLEAQKARLFAAEQNSLNREFNHYEAELNRDFNSSEAQLAREWSERMDSTAIQRRVNDLRAAGINPALAGGMSSSMPSARAASAAAASYNNSGSAAAASYNNSGFSGSYNPGGALISALRSGLFLTAYQNQRDFTSNFLGALAPTKTAKALSRMSGTDYAKAIGMDTL